MQIYRASAPYKAAPSCMDFETKTWVSRCLCWNVMIWFTCMLHLSVVQGIVRTTFINKPDYDIDYRYSYSSERDGDGVRVYILDT